MVFRWGLLTPWKPHQVLWENGYPLVFGTRKRARIWAEERYGYIKDRADLRTEPHNWRMPRPVMVQVNIEVL